MMSSDVVGARDQVPLITLVGGDLRAARVGRAGCDARAAQAAADAKAPNCAMPYTSSCIGRCGTFPEPPMGKMFMWRSCREQQPIRQVEGAEHEVREFGFAGVGRRRGGGRGCRFFRRLVGFRGIRFCVAVFRRVAVFRGGVCGRVVFERDGLVFVAAAFALSSPAAFGACGEALGTAQRDLAL